MRNVVSASFIAVISLGCSATNEPMSESHEGLISETIVNMHADGSHTTTLKWVTPAQFQEEAMIRDAFLAQGSVDPSAPTTEQLSPYCNGLESNCITNLRGTCASAHVWLFDSCYDCDNCGNNGSFTPVGTTHVLCVAE